MWLKWAKMGLKKMKKCKNNMSAEAKINGKWQKWG